MDKIEYESKLFEHREQAERALERLSAIGYTNANVSLILREADLPVDQNFASDTSPLAAAGGLGGVGVAAGAITGGLIGALVAAAASAALIVVSEGAAAPVVAGPLVAALSGIGAGAVSGTIVGGLLEIGVEAEDWRAGLQRGGVGVVVALKAHDDRAIVRTALLHSR